MKRVPARLLQSGVSAALKRAKGADVVLPVILLGALGCIIAEMIASLVVFILGAHCALSATKLLCFHAVDAVDAEDAHARRSGQFRAAAT